MRRWVYVLAEKWGQRPNQILDGMTSAELSEAIAYYLLLQDEESETVEKREERQRIDRQLADARTERERTRAMGN